MSTETRYERRDRIATGGMGEVWRAQDTVLGREVAVKVLKREYADDPGFRDRFQAEARHAASLHHPAIAAVFDFGELDGVPFLVMELVEGRPLSELVREGALEPDRVRDLVRQTAEGLATAHAVGLVHRDVKPANLLVTPAGLVKITDFGIARAADSMALTQTGQIIGTPQYLSPEQAAGASATPASDVYALGVVLFECLTGERPFAKESSIATVIAHLREPVPELPPGIPTDLAAVTRRALAKDPADRYADAGALAVALTPGTPATESLLIAPEPGQAGPAAPAPVPASTALLTGPVPGEQTVAVDRATAERQERRRPPWPVLVMAALAALLLVVLAVVRLDGGPDRAPVSSGPTPSATSSPSTATVAVRRARIVASAYVGKRATVARTALSGLGFTHLQQKNLTNAGGHDAGTVAGVGPTGSTALTHVVVISVWGAAPVKRATSVTRTPAKRTPVKRTPRKKPAPHAPAKHHHGKGKGHR